MTVGAFCPGFRPWAFSLRADAMTAVSSAIAARSRKNFTAILQGLATVGQSKVADLTGISETKVSRFKTCDLEELAALMAACGLKAVPVDMQCFDPEYVKALKVMAGVGLKQPEPQLLDWGDQQ
jgi:hypothetical protein